MMTNKDENRVVLITGSARRIGAEIAKELHAAHMNIVLHYNLSEDEALRLINDLNNRRENSVIGLRADLQETDNHKQFLQSAYQHWNRLDAIVNNASRFYRTEIGSTTEYAWDDLIGINLKVPYFLSQTAIPYLREHQGCIVNIADIHGDKPLKDYGVYSISKSGLLMMTKVLARELGPNIRVNAISPGMTLWPEGKNGLSDGMKGEIIDKITLKRIGKPEDIAKATLYLIRDADYVTGQIITVDGGRSLK